MRMGQNERKFRDCFYEVKSNRKIHVTPPQNPPKGATSTRSSSTLLLTKEKGRG
jgi:hypothetical protein